MAEYSDDSANPQESRGEYWRDQLTHAEELSKDWVKRGERVVARYRDERDIAEKGRNKFNILWSNTQVLLPSLYGRPAKPEVSRRYMDSDPSGRVAATILERVLEYEVDQFEDYGAAMRSAVEDRLLPGRGTAWVRFAPVTNQVPEQTTNTKPEPVERIDAAHAPVDYVYWQDFRHSPARTWDEVCWVARRVYMTKEEGTDRFGEEFANVPLDAQQTEDTRNKAKQTAEANTVQKATIWEIWDKDRGTVCWIAPSYRKLLDEREDPLGLEGFFPCPKPLFATTTNGSLIPVPDYCEYQDQAEELDSITNRIHFLVQAIKAAGVFNSEYVELTRLLKEGSDNKMFPVKNWAALAEKGGLKGAMEMIDLSTQIQALATLYKAREDAKQTIYEICGISDILRGASDAQETLGAQQLKANFGSLRLRKSQADVARFASDLFRLKAQIICRFYPPDLIIAMSGIAQTPDGQNQQLVMQALQLLKNGTLRDFQIAVESDTLAQIDEIEEKQAANELIGTVTTMIAQAGPMVSAAPETAPLFKELLLFIVRRNRAGRGLESTIEQTMAAVQQKPQPPNPEMIKMQAQQQADQMRAQTDIEAAKWKAQLDAQVQQGKLQQEMRLEEMKSQQEKELADLEGRIKLQLGKLDSDTKILIAQIQADTAMKSAQLSSDTSKEVEGAKLGADERKNAQKLDADIAIKRMEKTPPLPAELKVVVPRGRERRIIERDSNGQATAIVIEPLDAPAVITSNDGGEIGPVTVSVEGEPGRLDVKRDSNGLIREVEQN